jgi:hypothetical protein
MCPTTLKVSQTSEEDTHSKCNKLMTKPKHLYNLQKTSCKPLHKYLYYCIIYYILRSKGWMTEKIDSIVTGDLAEQIQEISR